MARKRKLERDQRSTDTRALLTFLLMARSTKQEALAQLTDELAMLEYDIHRVRQRLEDEIEATANTTEALVMGDVSGSSASTIIPSGNNSNTNTGHAGETEPEVPVISEDLPPPMAKRSLISREDTPTVALVATRVASTATVEALESRILISEHYADLQSCYFSHRATSRRDIIDDDSLDVFGQKMARISRLTRIRQVSALRLGDLAGSANIISSIEFNRDATLFATAGVAKKIRFYDFRDALNPGLDLHCPVREISSRSKLSCLSWNSYLPMHLAAADYEGLVTVYDGVTGLAVAQLEEHEKRAWSVDYSSTDPTRLASGSDDCLVKLWSTRTRKSICTIDGKANVCSVRFHPERGHLLAFGSADHSIHLYDLRQTNRALDVLKGHRKAVSYVRFLDATTLVSASTDCSLKLWSLASPSVLASEHESSSPAMPGSDSTNSLPWTTGTSTVQRTYTGHLNEKNFVGLSVQGDLFACGSENNSLYVYHRDLSKPISNFNFSSTCPVTESALESEVQQFVSSLCWQPDGNLLVAANSQGHIRVLEIV